MRIDILGCLDEFFGGLTHFIFKRCITHGLQWNEVYVHMGYFKTNDR